MKTAAILLTLVVLALSYQLNETARQRDESDRRSRDCLTLIEAWQRIAKRNEAGAEYWFRAHMETIRLQETNNPTE